MSTITRDEVLEKMRGRYARAKGRKYKTRLINELCEMWNYERKYAIKLLGKTQKKKKQKTGPKVVYDKAVLIPLKYIWLKANQPCSKRLKALIPLWLRFYEKHKGTLDDSVREKLLCISPTSMDRLLKSARIQQGKKSRCGTKPGTLLKTKIPVRCESWDVKEPGFFEADTVAHCGGSLSGDFLWSLTFVDILTGWSANRAVYNKGAEGVLEQVRDVESKLPFAILGFDSDNGSEFLNHHLYGYFCERKTPVNFTRSRAYHKNDQAHVEQKNWTHVREWLGNDRLEDPELVKEMDRFYEVANQFQNYFCPSMKLIKKERIKSRYKKKYDDPQTPYERLKKSGKLSKEKRAELEAEFQKLDPFRLREKMEKQLKKIFRINKAYQLKKAA